MRAYKIHAMLNKHYIFNMLGILKKNEAEFWFILKQNGVGIFIYRIENEALAGRYSDSSN